jgi:hypothetical protein
MAVRNTIALTHKSINASTAVAAGTRLSGAFTAAGMSITRTSTGTVTVQLQGSIDGSNWISLGAAQSGSTAGTAIYRSTGTFLVGHIRANMTAHAAPGAATVWVIGAP